MKDQTLIRRIKEKKDEEEKKIEDRRRVFKEILVKCKFGVDFIAKDGKVFANRGER